MKVDQLIIPPRTARIFYAAALFAFGVQHFMFGFLIAGRPLPWPEGLPGELIAAYVSGSLFVITACSILLNRKAVEMLIATAVFILLWSGLRNLFHVVTELDYGGVLTNTGKALTLGSAALLVASTFDSQINTSFKSRFVSFSFLCKYFTGLFLLASGIQHFIFAEFVQQLIPSWIPGALFFTYFAGVALIAAGVGLITGIKTKLAATLAAWMVLLWVFLLHIPRAIEFNNQNEWTAVFEALAVSGILFLIASSVRKD